ncbi:unnamed protein product [Auanema sp. JU1783]|nr:unnamed protein product [Auanema sp. JU1783]
MSGSNQELVVRVPRKNDLRRFSILKFSNSDNVDPSEFRADSEVRLEREDNRHVVMSTQSVQEYGEGSEYGKAAREEARRKRYGRQARTYHLDNQPWNLNFLDTDNRERQMRSIREGDGHSDNWIFVKEGDSFMAYKVDDMHRFIPAITHKTLDIDQAEEKFSQRNKVMNQFALKAQIMNQLTKSEEDGEQLETRSRNLKIKDEHSSSESGNEEEDAEEAAAKAAKKKKLTKKPTKDKRQRVENSDEVAKYESEDGEDEGREYDYMSDSGSDSELVPLSFFTSFPLVLHISQIRFIR